MNGGGFTVSPVFYHMYEALVVPAGAMQVPQYHTGDTSFVSYATLGSLVAEELAKAIGDRGTCICHSCEYKVHTSA